MDATGVETTESPSGVALLDWSGALNSAAATLFGEPVWLDACEERHRALHAAVTGTSSDAPVKGGAFAEAGHTRLGGRVPVNPSGGLIAKGHPIAATGAIQIHELVTQLRHQAGARQVQGARLAVALNGGGFYAGEEAVAVATVLERV